MINTLIRLCITGIIVLTGCQTYDANSAAEKASNTTQDAAMGASMGGVLSYLEGKNETSKKRRESMLRAAGIGTIAGGGVGYYMDTQEAKLRKTLDGSGVSLVRDGDIIKLIMPANITFKNSGDDVNPDFFAILDSVVLVLQEFRKTIVVVAGHTDSQGAEGFNQSLSERRADSVVEYIISKQVLEARIESVGFGETIPLADNTSEAGRVLNRRVEISLIPLAEE